MSHSQFHSMSSLLLDTHGVIFETSIWLLAGSTRYKPVGPGTYVQSVVLTGELQEHHMTV